MAPNMYYKYNVIQYAGSEVSPEEVDAFTSSGFTVAAVGWANNSSEGKSLFTIFDMD